MSNTTQMLMLAGATVVIGAAAIAVVASAGALVIRIPLTLFLVALLIGCVIGLRSHYRRRAGAGHDWPAPRRSPDA